MDFQRLFKRKEGPAPAMGKDNARDTLNERDVLVCEGELLDGSSPASLNWGKVGGAINVKADQILGILEGRTRIKAALLQELYPGLFEKAPNLGTEFFIPLQAVVMQLEDLFAGVSSEEAELEGFDTPFGQLAREDEARFKEKHADQPEVRTIAAPKLFLLEQPGSKPVLKEQDQSAALEKMTGKVCTQKQNEEKEFNKENGEDGKPSEARKIQNHKIRREGHEYLQELYLTDEVLDGSKVADMILRLPRVTGVVIMRSDGAVLGGGLSGGLNEALLNLAPDFVKHLLGFTTSMQGGPAKFVTFSSQACHLSLAIGGDVLLLTGHQGKNLPPGLRERLVATAQALCMIYGPQS